MNELDFLKRVARFNEQAQMPPPDGTFNADRVGFYTGCQLEELAEKIEVIGKSAIDHIDTRLLQTLCQTLSHYGMRFKNGHFKGAVLRADREQLLSEDIDVAVVTAGALCYQTPHFVDAALAICDANDQKWVNGVKRDEVTGKVLKPAGWTAADLSRFIIKAQD